MTEEDAKRKERQPTRWLLTHALALCLGGALAFGVLGLLNRTRPVPLVIHPPQPTVTPAPTGTPEPVAVYIHGEVMAPGVYSLAHDALVEDVLAAAGGLTGRGSLQGINLAQPVVAGLELEVLAAVDEADRLVAGGEVSPTAVPTTGDGGPLDLNQASAAELQTLPGIGPSTAEKIVAYREEHGHFESIEAIMEVPGIGPAKFNDIQDLIRVEP